MTFIQSGETWSLHQVLQIGIHAYWTLAIFSALVAILPHSCSRLLGPLKNAVILSARRGKLVNQKKEEEEGSEWFRSWVVPQAWFSHFYIVGLIFGSVLLMHPTVLGICETREDRMLYLCAVSFSFIHVFRRAIETVSMMQYPEDAMMHGMAYIFGLSYYVLMPLTILAPLAAKMPALGMNEIKNISFTGNWIALVTTALGEMRMHHIAGLIVFLVGNAMQWHSHYILAHLTPSRKRPPRKSRYVIPRGGLFNLVSCPHYFAEIVIYAGVVLIGYPYALYQFSPVLLWYPFVWVVVNLVLAAQLTHAWYKDTFKTYPPKRRALIPFVY